MNSPETTMDSLVKSLSNLTMDDVNEGFVRFLTGDFPFSPELQAFWMAMQGAMAVRMGPNKHRSLHWFHAFTLSTLAAFAGGIFNFIWMGKPSGILANDLFMASCIVSFVIVNYTPFDFGFKLMKTLPFSIVMVSFAQLFRSLGLVKFSASCYDAFKDSPSAYYPTPVFGPILYGTLLGNMGGLVLKGLEAHVGNGVPWPVQNGLFCASFYHFYVHDKDGIIGKMLRKHMVIAKFFDLDDKTFACAFVSLFMQIMGILQMPEFLGPSFTPFGSAILTPFMDSSTWSVGKYEGAYAEQQKEKITQRKPATKELNVVPAAETATSESKENETTSQSKKKRKNKNKKKTA